MDASVIQLLSLIVSTAGGVALAWIAYKQASLASEQKKQGERRDRKLDALDETCRAVDAKTDQQTRILEDLKPKEDR